MSFDNGPVAPTTAGQFSTFAAVAIVDIVIAVSDAAKGPAASNSAKPTTNISKALKVGSITVTINRHTGNVSGKSA